MDTPRPSPRTNRTRPPRCLSALRETAAERARGCSRRSGAREVCGARLDVAAPAIVGRQEHHLPRSPRQQLYKSNFTNAPCPTVSSTRSPTVASTPGGAPRRAQAPDRPPRRARRAPRARLVNTAGLGHGAGQTAGQTCCRMSLRSELQYRCRGSTCARARVKAHQPRRPPARPSASPPARPASL